MLLTDDLLRKSDENPPWFSLPVPMVFCCSETFDVVIEYQIFTACSRKVDFWRKKVRSERAHQTRFISRLELSINSAQQGLPLSTLLEPLKV